MGKLLRMLNLTSSSLGDNVVMFNQLLPKEQSLVDKVISLHLRFAKAYATMRSLALANRLPRLPVLTISVHSLDTPDVIPVPNG